MSPRNPSVLINHADIQKRVGELAAEISAWLEADADADAPLVLWLAEGALYFAADLTRNIKCDPLEIRSLKVSSYGLANASSGKPVIAGELPDVRGRKVLLVDDILDTGRTLETVHRKLSENGAGEIRTCFLLDKKTGAEKCLKPDYVGFEVENVFVFGYGLDYSERGRNFPDIMRAE